MRWLDLLGLVAMAVCACATIPIHTDADTELVGTAAARLGLEPEYLAEAQGAIEVEIVPKRHYHHGEAVDRKGCRRKVVSTADTAVLAHELGHALGLGHVDSPDNVMTPHAGDDADRLTAAQRRGMAASLALLRACREGTR